MDIEGLVSNVARQPAEPHGTRGLPQGLFYVDANGQATYRLALPLPACMEGCHPLLEIVYQHRLPNGVLGVGWCIDGLSAISRTGASYATDGYNGAVSHDARDRFALDQDRLVNVEGEYGRPGTIYRTHTDKWRHVRAGRTDADGFVAITREGEIWSYGTTVDSRLLAQGSGKVRVWALDSIEDAHGNRLEYRYAAVPVEGGADCGMHYLERISYRRRDDPAPRPVVAFAYEERPDPVTVFIGGYGASTLYRLRQVSVWRDSGAPAHCYDFEYACGTATRLSRLSSITERGAPDPARSYLPLISVSWQDTPSPGFDIGTPVALQAHARTLDVQSIDISGNGCTDLVHFWLDERDVLHATSYLADTAGTFSSGVVSTLGAFPPDRQVLPADLDGDGRVDLLVAYRHPGTGNLVLAPFLSNGAAFEALTEHDTGDQYCADHLGFYAMDVNGDGRTDLVEAYAHSDPQRGKLLYFRSYLSLLDGSDTQLFAPAQVSATPDPAFTARQFALLPMDVNGDGMIDLVRVWADGPTDEVHVTAYLAVATAIDSVTFAVRRHTSLGVLDPGSQCAFLPVDINGDGIMDLLRVWEEASDEGPVLHLASLISNGAGGFVNGPDSRFPGRSFDPDGFYPIGFSGGGQTQVLNTWSTEDGERMLAVYAPSPSGLFRLITEQHAGVAGAPACGERVLVGDVNGDGKADLVCVGADGEGLPAAQVYLSRGPYPDLVSRVRDHHGAVTTIDYAPLSDSSIYAAPRPADFPESAALRYPAALSPGQFPVEGVLGQAVYVVAQYTQRHPAGCYGHNPIRHFSFSYADARVDLLDRGWLGFREVRLVNP